MSDASEVVSGKARAGGLGQKIRSRTRSGNSDTTGPKSRGSRSPRSQSTESDSPGPNPSGSQARNRGEPPPRESRRRSTIGTLPGNPLIVPRDQHNISRKKIDQDCLKVMARLNEHGYFAFLVGGAVRDLLLDKLPKDYDVGTDASPEQVRGLFRNSRIIGKRFRLNQVYFRGNKIIEVSTFRDEIAADESEVPVTLAKDNRFGNPETDAFRRDLTINGLFYDPSTYSVVDYVGGVSDLESKVVRLIGDPERKLIEDPVRMVRVVRHAARTGFVVEENTLQQILNNCPKLQLAPKARIYDEVQRELTGGYFAASLRLLQETGIFSQLCVAFGLLTGLSSEARLRVVAARIDQSFTSENRDPSVAFALAAMFVGSLDPQQLSALGNTHAHLAAIEHFSRFPKLPDLDESDPPKVTGARKKSPLAALIDKLLDPLAVPRREREDMEHLLTLRLMILTSNPVDRYSRAILGSRYFHETIELMKVTISSVAKEAEQEEDVISSWLEVAESRTQRSRRHRRR